MSIEAQREEFEAGHEARAVNALLRNLEDKRNDVADRRRIAVERAEDDGTSPERVQKSLDGLDVEDAVIAESIAVLRQHFEDSLSE